MKVLYILLLSFAGFWAQAQCDLSTITYGNTSVTETQSATLLTGINNSANVRFRIQDIDYMLHLQLKTYVTEDFQVGVKDSLVFWFDDGSQLTVFPMDLYYVRLERTGRQRIHFTPEYYLTEEDIETLARKKLVRFVLHTSATNPFDFEIRDRFVADFQKAARCILDAE